MLTSSADINDEEAKDFFTMAMGNFMKKQYLVHNNGAVENHVIADHLNELSNGDLSIENPDDLVSTNLLLRTMGLNKKHSKSNKSKYKTKKMKYTKR